MWSRATVTHYTYIEYVERGHNVKEGMFRCGNTVLQASIYTTYPNSIVITEFMYAVILIQNTHVAYVCSWGLDLFD